MERYNKNKVNAYIPLFEGRKTAIKILQDFAFSAKAQVKSPAQWVKETINELEKYDPTKNGKYLDLFANFLIDDLKSGKVVNIKFSYEKLKNDLTKLETKGVKLDLHRYHKKSKEEFEKDVSNLVSKKSGKDLKKAKRTKIGDLKEYEDYIELNVNEYPYRFLIPLHYTASVSIASTACANIQGQWCTGAIESPKWWNDYVNKHKDIMLYCINENALNPYKKLAVRYNSLSMKVVETRDSKNNEISESIIPGFDDIPFEDIAISIFDKYVNSKKVIAQIDKLREKMFNELGINASFQEFKIPMAYKEAITTFMMDFGYQAITFYNKYNEIEFDRKDRFYISDEDTYLKSLEELAGIDVIEKIGSFTYVARTYSYMDTIEENFDVLAYLSYKNFELDLKKGKRFGEYTALYDGSLKSVLRIADYLKIKVEDFAERYIDRDAMFNDIKDMMAPEIDLILGNDTEEYEGIYFTPLNQ